MATRLKGPASWPRPAGTRPRLHDIADLFDGQAGSVYLDSCHFLPEGSQLIADRMYEVLEGRGR